MDAFWQVVQVAGPGLVVLWLAYVLLVRFLPQVSPVLLRSLFCAGGIAWFLYTIGYGMWSLGLDALTATLLAVASLVVVTVPLIVVAVALAEVRQGRTRRG